MSLFKKLMYKTAFCRTTNEFVAIVAVDAASGEWTVRSIAGETSIVSESELTNFCL